ncbi:hypothetical protein CYMTET_19213 [Cymbomonas tetramitiformis]|uniref:Plastid lipid-associated protein/fibrillin conserved domain-containing protein n=1 Tax=Cymbomonas tetramitiformis TaxID=36881 RepID=A0AAE0G7T5_9CHLO|nr:hypothetical protein CYMTET_19213 [Cymbomonas tetramitiformis]
MNSLCYHELRISPKKVGGLGATQFSTHGARLACSAVARSAGNILLHKSVTRQQKSVSIRGNSRSRESTLIAATNNSSDGVPVPGAAAEAKSALLAAIEGTDRGIFGLTSARRKEIEELAKALAEQNRITEPMSDLCKVAGEWKLLYTTIQILGKSRTKLGLRSLVKLGDFVQRIDIDESRAFNEVDFHVSGLGMINGSSSPVSINQRRSHDYEL